MGRYVNMVNRAQTRLREEMRSKEMNMNEVSEREQGGDLEKLFGQ